MAPTESPTRDFPDDPVGIIREQWRAARPELDTSPIDIIGRLHRVGDAVRLELIALYRQFDLGEGEFDVLAALRRAGDLVPSALAEHTMITSGGMSKRLDRLESAGLVTRRGNHDDGRSRVVSLTEAGRNLIDRAFEAHLENERRLLAPLPPTDREALRRALQLWGAALGV